MTLTLHDLFKQKGGRYGRYNLSKMSALVMKNTGSVYMSASILGWMEMAECRVLS